MLRAAALHPFLRGILRFSTTGHPEAYRWLQTTTHSRDRFEILVPMTSFNFQHIRQRSYSELIMAFANLCAR